MDFSNSQYENSHLPKKPKLVARLVFPQSCHLFACVLTPSQPPPNIQNQDIWRRGQILAPSSKSRSWIWGKVGKGVVFCLFGKTILRIAGWTSQGFHKAQKIVTASRALDLLSCQFCLTQGYLLNIELLISLFRRAEALPHVMQAPAGLNLSAQRVFMD